MKVKLLPVIDPLLPSFGRCIGGENGRCKRPAAASALQTRTSGIGGENGRCKRPAVASALQTRTSGELMSPAGRAGQVSSGAGIVKLLYIMQCEFIIAIYGGGCHPAGGYKPVPIFIRQALAMVFLHLSGYDAHCGHTGTAGDEYHFYAHRCVCRAVGGSVYTILPGGTGRLGN